MQDQEELGAVLELEATRYGDGAREPVTVAVPTEVPLTIVANGVEMATLLCTPTDLECMARGFLFSSGLIHAADEIRSLRIDPTRWLVTCDLARTPDPELLDKRVYTSGCGKGVLYTNIIELSARHPLTGSATVTPDQICALANALQGASSVYRRTRGVHTAALALDGAVPERWFDDVGRHNAVDKAVGDALARGADFARCALVSSGRTSSEILHKARRAGIPICVSRSVPTHQSVLRARDMGVTLIGGTRGNRFLVYSHGERIAAGAGAAP